MDLIFKNKKIILLIFLALFISLVAYLRLAGFLNYSAIIGLIQGYPLEAPFIFILIYVLMIIFLVPTLPMNLGAGFLWGPFMGGIIALISAILGGSVSFFLSRYLFFEYFEKKFQEGKWHWLRKTLLKNDWKIIVFTRVNPAFPFGLVSYFFGSSPVSFRRYILSTALAILPVVFIFAAIGDAINGLIMTGKVYDLVQDGLIIVTTATFLWLIYAWQKSYRQARLLKKEDKDKIIF